MFAAVGRPFDYELLGRARWTSRAMVATKFRERRVFLAGDAAHLWIPMGGFGMNAGIADAVSLSWRLAGVLRGWLAPRILDPTRSSGHRGGEDRGPGRPLGPRPPAADGGRRP